MPIMLGWKGTVNNMQDTYAPEGLLLSTPENREYLIGAGGLERAMERRVTLESTVLLCDKDMNLHIDLGKSIGIMPREEVQYCRANEEIKDIAVLTRVGKPIAFKVIGFSRDEYGQRIAILSRRAAQEDCLLHYISTLCPGDIIPAKVTHMESFGAFLDIGCGIVSLLSIDCISVSRISHPKERFSVGDHITVAVRKIDADHRIFVTHRELLGTWQENASRFSVGQTVVGVVRSVESYGIFIELTPNLAGLAELKEDVTIGENAAVYIKNIIPEKMKIKLIVIDAHAGTQKTPPPFRYFMDETSVSHIDSWRYSPPECDRVIETVFE